MRKLILLLPMVAMMMLGVSCGNDAERNTEPLVDPWLRERTPASLRLEGQVGAAVITDDWRDDTKGTISVTLLMNNIPDISSVNVESFVLKYSESTATISAGSKLDLSSGTASFVVTSKTEETRTYQLSYKAFLEPFEGTYTFAPRAGVLDAGAAECAFVAIGGYDGNIVMSTPMDKPWQWPNNGSSIPGENDNTVSIKLGDVNSDTGTTYGTAVNTAGNDGLYADFIWNNGGVDLNGFYRVIPTGKSRWSKDTDGNIIFYKYETTDYSEDDILSRCNELESGAHVFWEKTVEVANYALYTTFAGPFDDISDTGDGRFMKNNLRNTFTLLNKTADTPMPDHDDLLEL